MATLQSRLSLLAAAIRDKINTMVPRLLPSGGTTGQALVKNSNSDYDTAWSSVGGSDGWTYLFLTADLTVKTTTAVDAAGLSFTPAANTSYEIEGKFLLRSSVTTTGPRIGLGFPTGLIDGAASIHCPSSATADVLLQMASNATSGVNANTGVAVINVSYLGRIWSLIRAGASPTGNFVVRLASEVAASAVTMRAGSFIRYRALAS